MPGTRDRKEQLGSSPRGSRDIVLRIPLIVTDQSVYTPQQMAPIDELFAPVRQINFKIG